LAYSGARTVIVKELHCKLIVAVFFFFTFIKFRYYDKATKFEKNIPPVLTKQLVLLSSIKTSGRFFKIFVAFSEKLRYLQALKKLSLKV
jgi:hypothetical protein